MNAIKETHFHFPAQTGFYKGKVRDVYSFENKIAAIVTDRISAFDVVLPEAIPYKGQVLNKIAAKFLKATSGIVPNWVLDVPDPNVTIGLRCTPYPVEMVIRGYLAGHAWREYSLGKRMLCGVHLPEGLKENDKLPQPIITPTTKADHGHDLDISREEILEQRIIPKEEYETMEKYTHDLFLLGTEMAAAQQLILVDTKYEFGKKDGMIYLIDEVHTPDSSRYFYQSGYNERQAKGEKQKQLSKEFVRQWLIENGFQGKEGQKVPLMTPDIVNSISARYIELYEQVTGEAFNRTESDNALQRIEQNILKSLG
jgi:phosphoribosylaminoimidazole-succinocarboxamide synthase